MINLGKTNLDIKSIEKIIFNKQDFKISSQAIKKIESRYKLICEYAKSKNVYYGINTGFGALSEKRIERKDIHILQRNLLLSHAVGMGEPLSFENARILMLLRLNTLIKGHSGASYELIKMLEILFKKQCAPYVPKKGSVGASGDLAPLAHLGLLLIGKGKAYINNKLSTAKEALNHAKLTPLNLGIRDGLALINGTQAMAATGAIAAIECEYLCILADVVSALTLTALCGHDDPFDERIHALKQYSGQITSAKRIREALNGRTFDKKINPLTQDPYSLRCIPQVHGATLDVLGHVKNVICKEINSVTDNPLLFSQNNETLDILSGGNFHGQAIALALDYLAMGISELANISERRVELLLNPMHSRGLPAFLMKNSGINSGLMLMQTTASALVNENKVLCMPASIDSIPTSANREDHVSMGMTSANKLMSIIENVWIVLAIELVAAHQALYLRSGVKTSQFVAKIQKALKGIIPHYENDSYFKEDIDTVLKWLKSRKTKAYIENLFTTNNQ